ncbi:class I SAM-dependent methyltransferase [candidate division WOR-3 bacterium]|nr:class I SAM-dependent methyltransferase [candidate division WOR-3 bacterium]
MNPRPTQREIVRFYSRSTQYDPWLEEETGRNALWNRRLRTILKYRQSGRLLDVGTGTGQFLAVARRHFEVHGTEVSSSGVKIARDRYGLSVFQGELGSTDFGCTFDVVTLFHVLEHVPSPSSTVGRCRELMSDEGILLIAVPNDIYRLRSVARQVLAGAGIGRYRCPKFHGVSRIALNGSQQEIHLSHFTPAVLRHLLSRHGLSVSATTLDPYYVGSCAKDEASARRRYHLHLLFYTLVGINLYDTMLVVARPTRTGTPQ